MAGLTPLRDKHIRRENPEESVITSQPMELMPLDFNQNNSRKNRGRTVKKKKDRSKLRKHGGEEEGYSSSSQVSKATSTSSLDESYFEYLRAKKKKKKRRPVDDNDESGATTSGSGLDSSVSSRSVSRKRAKKSKPSKIKLQEQRERSPETPSPRPKSRAATPTRARPKRVKMVHPALSSPATSKTTPTTSPTESKTSISESSLASEKKKEKKKKKKKGKKGKKQGKLAWLFTHMCKSGPDESRLLKAVLWFPIGCIISLVLYFLIIRKINMEEKNKAAIGGLIGAILALSFAFSTQIRCTLSLVLPSFMGKAGRSYVTAFAIIYLINGPITNIIGNTKEVVRSLTCNSALMANHSKAKWRLRLHPIEGALGDLTKDNFQLNRVARGIKRAFAPLRREILRNMVEEEKLKAEINRVEKMKREEEGNKKPQEDTDEETVRSIEKAHKNDEYTKDRAKVVEKEWKKKLDLRCRDIFSKGVLRCREKMKQLERKCRRAIKVVGSLLCWPLKITVFCNIVKIIPNALGVTCSDLDVVRPGLGETFLSARAVVDDVDQGMNVKMQYRIEGDPEGIDYTPVEEVRAATMHEVEERSAFIKLVFSMISSVLTFTFLIVFKSAFNYNTNYLTQLEYDNVYITKYFKHIDARRKDAGKDTLFPLKKFEKQDIIDPMKIRLSKEEKGQIRKGTGRLILRIIIAAIICYMDSLLYQVLDIISRNSRVEYHQEGEHFIKITVQGNGFMSALVRNFLLRFNTNQTLDQVTTNHHCLPAPEETDDLIIGFIFGTYILVWVFMYFESFGLRMRHVIAGFFYRKVEKKRVLHLYNEMFRRRIGYLAHLRKVIKKSIRKRTYKKKTSLFVSLQHQYPKYFGWLKRCKSPKENCIICEDREDEDFHLCSTPGCGIAYCEQCWIDVNEKCLACKSRGDESDKSEDDEDEDDFDTDSSDLSGSE